MGRKATSALLFTVLLVIPIGTYAWYVAARRAEISQLNQRELGRAAENLQATIDVAIVNVRNLASNPAYACSLDREQPYLSFSGPEDCYQPLPWNWSEAGLRGTLRRVTIEAPGNGGAAAVSLDVNVSKVLRELALADSFEYLIVANDKGEVVFQESRGMEASWGDAFRWFEEYSRPLETSSSPAVRLVTLSQLPLSSGEKLEYGDLTPAGTSVRVRLAGADYDLFVQPLRFKQADTIWTLGGLVNVANSTKKAMVIAPQITFGLVVLLALGLLAWPFIKRWALAPNERPTFADGYLLLLSTSATLMVATVVLLDLDNYRALNETASNSLREFADDVSESLLSELSSMRSQLQTYDEFLKNQGREAIDCRGLAQATHLLLPPAERPRIAGTRMAPMPEPTEYEALNLVFWAAPDGSQIIKTTTDIETTPRVSVASRLYFQEPLAGRLWAMAGDDEQDAGFYLQPFRSITTGVFSSGLAIRSKVPPDVCSEWVTRSSSEAQGAVIAVLTAPLSSAGDQALPSGYGFAVVDRRGRVLLHSDSRRALREELFDELSEPRRLHAALLSTSRQSFASTYRARPHEFHVRPLEELVLASAGSPPSGNQATPVGWHVVVFRDLEVAGTVNGQVLATSFLWIFTYALVLQILPTMLSLMMQPRRVRWLWPHGFNAPLYRRLTLQLACVALVSVALQRLQAPNSLFLVAWLSPLVTVAISLGNYLRWFPRVRPENWEGCNRPALAGAAVKWHFSSVTLLWFLLAVLPAAGFFKLAWNEEFGRLFAYQSSWQHEQARDITRVVEQGGKLIPGLDKFLKDRLAYLSYDVGPFRRREEPLATPDAEHGFLFQDYAFRLHYYDLSARLHYQHADQQLLSQAGLQATAGPITVLGGLALFAILAWWIRYSANKLLLADMEDEPLSEKRLVSVLAESDRPAILVIAPKLDQQQRIFEDLQRHVAQVVSARAAAGGSTVNQPPRARQVNLSVGLEQALLVAESRRNKLAELEAAVFQSPGRMIVFFRVDPFEYVAKLAPACVKVDSDDNSRARQPEVPPDELRRWRAVREEFAVIRVGNTAEEIAQGAGDTQCEQPVGNGLSVESALLHQDPCRLLWDSTTDTEKLVLIHVAEEGFANPAQRETVRQLLRRGLLVLQPDLRLVNESFRAFVRRSQDPALVSRWEKPVGKVGWGRAKWILLVPLVSIGVFLFGTQREWLATAAGAITALTAILSGVLKLADQLSRRQPMRASGE